MLKTMFAGLLTATALIPAAVAAQGYQANTEARGDYRQRGDRGGDRGSAQQAQARAQADAQVQAWVDADPRRGDQRDPRRDENRGGPDRGGAPQADGRGFQRPRDGDRGIQGRGDDGRIVRNDGYGDHGGGGQWRGNDRGGVGGGVGGGGQWRGDNRGGGQWQERNAQRGQWNRGWRQDDRYDWNRYRSTNRGAYRLPRYYAPQGGYGYRRFSVGVVLGGGLYGRNYWIDDPWSYRLPQAYGPYRWVRYYDDALLVDIRSGQVVDSVYGIFW